MDSASNNQIFLDFLGIIRNMYLKRLQRKTFQSVILAGVYDVKNLKIKIRPNQEHKYNSPWNTRVSNEENESLLSFDDCTRDHRELVPYDIAAKFDMNMEFTQEEIAGMLTEYEHDYRTGMDIGNISQLLFDYTSGYPFLVSRICQIIDENISGTEEFPQKSDAWTKNGFLEAVKRLLTENNTLFDDMSKKLLDSEELSKVLYAILFNGIHYIFNPDDYVFELGIMFGYLKNKNGQIAVANRIFETRIYNRFLSEEIIGNTIYNTVSLEKNQFIQNGVLNMDLVMEKFLRHFTEIYADSAEKFIEDNGRRIFLIYLKPIINGVGNYYVEARTRDQRRTDVIIDYRGQQSVVEMKIWHGNEYNERGKHQLTSYLEDYHLNKGYLLSFNFNKNKKTGMQTIECDGKIILEVVV